MTFAQSGTRTLSKPPLGSQINHSHPLCSGLVLALPLNEASGSFMKNYAEGQDYTDAEGHGDGLLKAVGGTVPTWAGGENGLAVKFPGDGGVFTCGGGTVDGIKSPLDLTVYTWAIKARFTTLVGLQNILCKQDNGLPNNLQYGLINNAGTITWQGTPAANDVAYTGFTFAADTWYTFTATQDTATRRVYLNGLPNNSGAVTTASRTFGVVFGNDARNNRPFSGYVEYAFCWNRPLTAEEVEWHYQEPYAMFRGPEVARNFAMFGA